MSELPGAFATAVTSTGDSPGISNARPPATGSQEKKKTMKPTQKTPDVLTPVVPDLGQTLLDPVDNSSTLNAGTGLTGDANQSAHTTSTTSSDTPGSTASTSATPAWPAATVQIKDMSPSTPSNWVLHALVIARGPVREWSNLRGGGTLQELFLVDMNNDFMRATLFNDAVTKFTDATKRGSSCSLAGGKIKFSIGASNATARECQLSFGDTADIQSIGLEAFGNVTPTLQCTQLAQLSQLPAGPIVNIIGILVQTTSTKRMISAQGKNLQKRELVLTDDTEVRVLCTLWGNNARDRLDQEEGHPVLIKGGQINDYMGTRSISANIGSSFIIEPALSRAEGLSAWYEKGVNHASFPLVQTP